MSWTTLKEYREMNPLDYVETDSNGKTQWSGRLVFISHRWVSPEHPDPTGEQLREIQRRIGALPDQDASQADAILFYDYCSMLQRPRTSSENIIFYRDIDALATLLHSASIAIILSEGYADYKNRAWCFFEAIASEGRIHFFDDQAHIRVDLEFLGSLLYEGMQITSYDFSYKTNLMEAEIIVATLQHLNNCRVTHAEDFPRIKTQMIRFFNERRLTPFGRLVTAIGKYFDITFAVWPDRDRGEALCCTPYFEEPEWDRLSLGGRSIFAIEPAQSRAAIRSAGGFVPVIRLTLPEVPEVEDQKRFDVPGILDQLRAEGDFPIDRREVRPKRDNPRLR